MYWLAIALGGAGGAMLRYGLSNAVHAWLGRGFPYGTLAVNVAGCLCMGLLYVWLLERVALAAPWRALLQVGLLGALTTFSAFALETLLLLEDGAVAKALANIVLSVLLCLLATWLGVLLGRQL